jgi:hypothetical protein
MSKDHYITVAQLREHLSELPDDMPVILQRDAEGNGYSPLSQVERAVYAAESPWAGECYEEPSPGDIETEDSPPEDAVKVVVLVPMN